MSNLWLLEARENTCEHIATLVVELKNIIEKGFLGRILKIDSFQTYCGAEGIIQSIIPIDDRIYIKMSGYFYRVTDNTKFVVSGRHSYTIKSGDMFRLSGSMFDNTIISVVAIKEINAVEISYKKDGRLQYLLINNIRNK